MSELTVTGAEKRFGSSWALRGVTAAFPAGRLTAILGPSGCGKTTLLRCVAGFERLDAGAVHLGGERIDGVPAHRRRIAVVPQEGALFPHLSVAANIGYGLPRRERRGARIAEVLELVGLSDYDRRMPHELSGGEQQRVAVARALAPRPALILLDEPFSALDASLRVSLRADIRTALHADAATAVLVTHDQDEALSVADSMVVMRDGRVRQSGRPQEVYSVPADPWVAGFVGEAVFVEGRVRGSVAETPLGSLSARSPAADGPARLLVRPEQIALIPPGTGEPTAVVDSADYFGHDALVTLRLADGATVCARTLNGVPEPGTEVGLRVEGEVSVYPA